MKDAFLLVLLVLLVLWGLFCIVILIISAKKEKDNKISLKEMGLLPLREDHFHLYDYYFKVRGADFESVSSKLDEIVKYLTDTRKCAAKPGQQVWEVVQHAGSYETSNGTTIDFYHDCGLELEEIVDGEIYSYHLRFYGKQTSTNGAYSIIMNAILTKVEKIFQEYDPGFICEKKLENPASIKRIKKIEKKQQRKKEKQDRK